MAESLFQSSGTLILKDRAAVEAYTRENIGFELELLLTALGRAGSEAAMTTEHNAASSFGYRFWDGLVAGLRDQLVPRSWTTARPGGLEVVRRPDNRLQMTGSLGDEAVCVESSDPSCRHQKGQSSDEAMRTNQLTLAGLSHGDPAWRPMLTWWVLYRFAGLDERTLEAELSLPRHGVAGQVSDWAVRLFLPGLEIGGPDGIDTSELPEPPAPVKVPIHRVGT